MGYDLCTNEYDFKYDNHYDFFHCLIIMLMDLIQIDFKPFEFMEYKMKGYLYQKTKGDDVYGI